MEKYLIIMAGGKGTRLWPISTSRNPKRFMVTNTGSTMIHETIERYNGIIPMSNIFVITSLEQKVLMEASIKGIIPAANILLEPSSKNTSACIAYSSLFIQRKHGDGILCFTPADSHIGDITGFKTTMSTTMHIAENTSKMVIIGIEPNFPATGYGYIKSEASEFNTSNTVSAVLEFTEKPVLTKAEEFLASGDYLCLKKARICLLLEVHSIGVMLAA